MQTAYEQQVDARAEQMIEAALPKANSLWSAQALMARGQARAKAS